MKKSLIFLVAVDIILIFLVYLALTEDYPELYQWILFSITPFFLIVTIGVVSVAISKSRVHIRFRSRRPSASEDGSGVAPAHSRGDASVSREVYRDIPPVASSNANANTNSNGDADSTETVQKNVDNILNNKHKEMMPKEEKNILLPLRRPFVPTIDDIHKHVDKLKDEREQQEREELITVIEQRIKEKEEELMVENTIKEVEEKQRRNDRNTPRIENKPIPIPLPSNDENVVVPAIKEEKKEEIVEVKEEVPDVPQEEPMPQDEKGEGSSARRVIYDYLTENPNATVKQVVKRFPQFKETTVNQYCSKFKRKQKKKKKKKKSA